MPTADLGFSHRFVPATIPSTSILLLLHGTGGNENDLVPLGQALAPGAALLSPRGQVLENGMPRFFRRLAEGVFDLDDLIRRTDELVGFVGAAAKAYQLDASKVIAVGYSNGANIAASLLLLRPGVLAGAILFHPMVPIEPEPLPDLTGTAVFIGAGRSDPLVAASETERLSTLLQKCGAVVTQSWQPGGHQLNQQEVNAAREWLGSQLRATKHGN